MKKKRTTSVGTFTGHCPCDACGSSDAGSLYTNGDFHCHGCGHHISGASGKETPIETEGNKRLGPAVEFEFASLTKRHITEETARHFGYGIGTCSGQPVQVANYRKPDGSLVGQKLRFADKSFIWVHGNGSSELYGRHLWRDGGKMVVITEGEIDAMSVSQMQGNKYPVVSLPSGAQHAKKVVSANIDWLSKFEKVVLFLDMDEPGQKAAKECAEILKPGTAFIASINNAKDANELLQNGRGKEIIDAVWGAKEYRPDGVISGTELWDKVRQPTQYNSVNYPFIGLNRLLHGMRTKEILTVVAGTGVGKSEFTRFIVNHIHKDNPGERVGVIALEESAERTALGFMGLHLKKRIHIDATAADEKQRLEAFKATVGSGRFYLYDHFGVLNVEAMLSRIRYMAVACGCKTILLDNLTALISNSLEEDERVAIDHAVTNLVSACHELDLRVAIVHHLKKTDSKHEEGHQVSLNDIRGSGGIGYYSNIIVALERNQQGKSPNTTAVRVLKNRHTGDTGVACHIDYNKETGGFTEVEAPFDAVEENPNAAGSKDF
jgi:twinkle protein